MAIKNGTDGGRRAAVSRILLFIFLFAGVIVVSSLYPALAFAGGHEDGSKLEHKVDIENKSGVNLIIARLYNDNRLLFALAVTVTMAVVGVIIGQLTGLILRFLGLK